MNNNNNNNNPGDNQVGLFKQTKRKSMVCTSYFIQ